MIQLHVRTEYSFRRAFGKLPDVLRAARGPAVAITDTGTWGHVAFAKACKAENVRPLFGAEVSVVVDARLRERQASAQVVLLARNDAGLQELYGVMSIANLEGFYYVPRLDYRDVNALSENVVALFGPGTQLDRILTRAPFYLMLTPTSPAWNRRAVATDNPCIVASDNHYPAPEDLAAYEIIAQRDKVTRPTPMHLCSEDELRLAIPEATDAMFRRTYEVADLCDAHLPKAENIKIVSPRSLYELCMEGARTRGMNTSVNGDTLGLTDPIYQARLERELAMIDEKNFHDYFYLVGDMVRWAKQHMLVGPARGSSAGSLMCFLLGITDVDPILHDLMFERFIDVTRADLPDVDIDFQDTRRELVVDYLREKYGAEKVGRIGTVARLKAKSCLGDVAQELGIPKWEMRDVQDAVIERSTGDARAQFCVQDALASLDVGKRLVEKYPGLVIAGRLEGHAQHSGKHAAGVMVSNEPILRYCSLDNSGTAQIDKKDAEALGLLKIDALGLRVLSVIQDTLDQIGRDRDWLVKYPLDDTAAFEVLNNERYSGIFQFEGYALQSLCRQMKVRSFDDLQVIGALARPGPLHCGAANDFIARRIGQEAITHMHPSVEPVTRETYGIVIYQEQVMAIGRLIGDLSWEDVNQLRRAMSKSMGDEFFNQYWGKFEAGALAKGVPSPEARRIWDKMCTFGSWAFNKSHSVSYGLISYWCCVLKAHYPLEFAAACLRNEKDEEQGVRILRDLVREGFTYQAVDPERSGLTWSVVEGKLIGGLTNIKGIGASKAEKILVHREAGTKPPPGLRKLLSEPKTPYDDIFPAARLFGHIYREPRANFVRSGKVHEINSINDPGEYVFIGRLKVKNQRDMNEYESLVKRDMRMITRNPLFLNMTLEDDSGNILGKITRYDYKRLGKPLIEKAKVGDWFLWKGTIYGDGWRVVRITQWRALDETSPLWVAPPEPKT